MPLVPIIDKFDGTEYVWLSNFYPSQIKLSKIFKENLLGIQFRDIVYPTVEHGYQALKATNKSDHNYVREAGSAAIAKKRGRAIKCREDWDKVKNSVMLLLLREKFKIIELRQKLLDTGEAHLIEGNTWGDIYWGQVNGKGKNMLGKLLMKVREEIQNEIQLR